MNACPSCNAELVAGKRRRSSCRVNLVALQIDALSSPRKRLAAHLVDAVVVVIVSSVSAAISLAGSSFLAYGRYIPPIASVVVALFHFAKGTAIGKRALGMRVVKEDEERAGFFTTLIRELIVKYIVAIPVSLALLWIMWDEDRQGWHDKIMNTWVVEKGGEDDSPSAPSGRLEDTDAYKQRRQQTES